MPPSPAADRNLLFGILALQMDFVSRDALIAAMNAWVLDKAKPLGQILCDQGALDADNRAWLEAGVERHLARHGNDPEKSLAAVSSLHSVRHDLQQIADPDVQASLVHVGTDPDATGPYVGPAVLPPHVRFQILRPHARGGLGEVFVARDEELHREVALKEIQERHAGQPESRARFLLEAEVTGSLEHPGIVPVYGLGAYADGRPFYAMRFIQGDSLKDAIAAFHAAERQGQSASERSLALRQLLGRFIDVCNAIAYAHSRGVLHRDLKPGNVMLGKFGETLVVDWGLAKVLGRAETEATEGVLVSSADSGLTQAGRALGTPAYMSPEQAAGRLDRLGPAADVYSLGATLYCLLTGRAPFTDGAAVVVLTQVQKGNFPAPRQVNASVPAALEAVCLKAMALRPEDRYATPHELAGEIEHFLADEPVAAYREPLTARLGRWVRKHQTLTASVGALLLTGLAAVAVGGLLLGREQARTLNEQQAKLLQQQRAREAQVNTLLDVAPQAVPAILEALQPHRDEIRPLLRQAIDKPEPRDVTAEALRMWRQHRARAALALLEEDPGQLKPLTARLLEEKLDPAEMLLVRDTLTPHAAALKELLWARAADKTKPDEQFRALVALAAFDPDCAGWKTHAATAVDQMVTENLLHLGTWVQGLRPVRGALQTHLAKVYREARSPERRELAARVLADYIADQPDLLADLLLDADPKQYAILLPTLKDYRDRTVERMQREVQGEGWWNDAPLDPAWAQPSAELRREVETADGLLAERWALCQTLPLERWPAVAEELQACGYRPVRLRPFAQEEKTRVAAVWTRDGRTWKAETGLTAAAVKERDAAQQQDGLIAADVASYGFGDNVRHAALWVKPGLKGEMARLSVGVPAANYKMVADGFKADGFIPWTLQGAAGGDGQARFAGVWWKADVMPKGADVAWKDDEDAQRGRVLLGEQLLIDVNVSPAPEPAPAPPVAERLRAALATANLNLAFKPNDVNLLFLRALARYNLRQNEVALADFDALITKVPTVALGYRYRAVLQARVGRAAEARRDLAEFHKLSTDVTLNKVVGAVVDIYLADAAALQPLEEAVTAAPKDASLAYNAASVHALAAEWTAAQQFGRVAALVGLPEPFGLVLVPPVPADRPGKLADRALALLRQACDTGYANRNALDTDPDLEMLRGRPGFGALKRHLAGPTAFASVWHGDVTREAAESHGLGDSAHLERCRELAAQGYRPAALSVALLDGKTVTASAWQRPHPKQVERERLARRQATGAATLLKMEAPADAWALFRHRPDPEARSQLVWRSQLLGVEAQQLVERLDRETDVSARRALILALGEYTDAQLPATVREPLTAKLLNWYRDDPDPGIHAAIDWLLRHGKEGPERRPLDWKGAAQLKEIDAALKQRDPDGKRNWYVNQQGQTYVCIPGPVEFRMGSPLTETERRENETAHRRRIPRSFGLASRSVTVEEFQRFCKDRPDVRIVTDQKRYSPAPDCPIIGLTWYEAAQYCNWLSAKEGLPETEWCYPKHADIKDGMKPFPDYLKRKGYRLPTEAEWEYAARAEGRSSRYFGSSVELLGRYTWYQQNSVTMSDAGMEVEEVAGSFMRSWPVGQKRPNDLGLFDSQGNVWNWVYDPYSLYPKQQGSTAFFDVEDTRDIKDLNNRLLRGGAFYDPAVGVRLSLRSGDRPSYRYLAIGLRPARTLP